MLTSSRDFTYTLEEFKSEDESVFLVSKSVAESEVPLVSDVIRGEIVLRIWHLAPSPQSVSLTLYEEISYKDKADKIL